MTNDAKNNLLKYLTNNATAFEPTSPIYALQNIDEGGVNTGAFNTADFTVNKIYGLIQAKDIINDIDLVIYYGYGTKTGNNHKVGCFIYCDKEGNFLQLVNTLSTGSELFCIYDVKINENSQMYAIGYDAQEADGVTHTRVLLFENIAQPNQLTNKYEVNLRISYRIQSSNYNDNTGGAVQHPENTKIIKDNTSASYLIYYRYINLFYMIRFKIVFGGSNEWEDYTTSANYLRSKISVEWDEENPLITILEQDATIKEYINKYYIISSSSTTTSQIDFGTPIQNIMDEYFSSSYTIKNSTICMVNSSIAYITFCTSWQLSSNIYGLALLSFKLEYSNNNITNTYYTSFDSSQDNFLTLNSTLNNNTQLVYATYKDLSGYENIVLYITNTDRGYSIFNDIITYNNNTYEYYPILYNIYNLTYVSVLKYDGTYDANDTLTWSFVYAEDTYVGDAYYGKNSLLADKVSLYDSNNNIIFNRDISNIVVQNNTATSSVNIPNIYLNTEAISKEDLVSKNNNIIVSSNTSIDKNIYENVYINFINSITMQDQNTAEYVYNQSGANRIVNSAFYTIDYEDAVMNKYKINYNDNTSYIGNIDQSQITYGTKEATYNFAIYLSKAADTLELISNDESTTYQTIDISNLSVGLYKISQHVYIQ